MTIRVVVLGNGRSVPLGSYVWAWREILSAPPDREYRQGLTGWWPETAETILRQFRDGMHERISRHLPGYGRGRKWSHDWQRAAYQDAQRINAPRLAVRRTEITTDDWRTRFAHRYTED